MYVHDVLFLYVYITCNENNIKYDSLQSVVFRQHLPKCTRSGKTKDSPAATNVQSLTRERCYDFENIFAENVCEKMAFFVRNTANFCKN
jgi:hypothetical protein